MPKFRNSAANSGLQKTKSNLSLKGKTLLKKAAANVPEIWGTVVWSSNLGNGLYKLPTAAGQSFEALCTPVNANGGAVVHDGILYTIYYMDFWGTYDVSVYGYDIENGNCVYSSSGSTENITYGMCVDPATNTIYGVTRTPNNMGVQLATIDFSSSKPVTTAIAEIKEDVNTIACSPDGQLYVITKITNDDDDVIGSNLCKINRTTGAITVVGETGYAPEYESGAVIDTKTGRMFWTVSPIDDTTTLTEIDVNTGKASPIIIYESGENIIGLSIAPSSADDNAPASPEELTVDFPNGSLEGTVSFNVPSVNFSGSPVSGNVEYIIYLNGNEALTGNTTYGSKVSVPMNVEASGTYTVEVRLRNDSGILSPAAATSLYIGVGVPASPQVSLDYSNGQVSLSWQPVDKPVSGGYFNPEEVTYTVTRFPGGNVVLADTKETSFTETLPEPENITTYFYEVVANYLNMFSGK
ncbi:MAG: hypothetical protein NC402_03375 [Prevotella sp.]|nr:hypothetical protein [Prevotella sp.]MCM1074965.1 hypothetical protein [Ruminococcus sp.]